MKSQDVTAFLITNFTNVSYLTGFSGDDSFLLMHTQGDIIISDTRYEIQISEECPGLEVHIRATATKIFDAVKKVLSSLAKSGNVGVEADSMTLAHREELAGTVPQWTVRPISEAVEMIRMLKDKYEIEAIRKSIYAAFRGFQSVRAGLRPDQTEIEIRNDLEYAMRRFGADDKGFRSIVAVGERAALPHAVPTSKRVEESELMLIDWGAKRDGYISDLTRTLVTTKKPSSKFRKLYEAVLTAQKKALDAIKPGEIAKDIDRVARKSLEEAGLGKYFTHNLGHGIGLEVHEGVRFSQSNETVLKAGMVITVEPGVYLPDWGGIRIEDNILVTKNGCEILTAMVPKEFDEMIVD